MKMTALRLVNLAWLLCASPAFAGGLETSSGPFKPIDAQALIDACWDMTYEKRLASNADAREGIFLSALCLEERILDQFDALFDPAVLPRQEAAERLKTMRDSYAGLAWKLYNEHEGCPFGHCGTIFYTFHVSAVARFMERSEEHTSE